jgi:GGDEF domain-containing protein
LRENRRLLLTYHLTRLANRMRLNTELERMPAAVGRDGHPVAVLLVDLDGFKQVNDVHGHQAGDEVLIAFARMLRHSVPAGAVEEATGESVQVGDGSCRAGASIGVAVSGPDADSPDLLLRRADEAMYDRKRARKAQQGRAEAA